MSVTEGPWSLPSGFVGVEALWSSDVASIAAPQGGARMSKTTESQGLRQAVRPS
jgi:hypothetical protein